jgi:hypothetical protein
MVVLDHDEDIALAIFPSAHAHVTHHRVQHCFGHFVVIPWYVNDGFAGGLPITLMLTLSLLLLIDHASLNLSSPGILTLLL